MFIIRFFLNNSSIFFLAFLQKKILLSFVVVALGAVVAHLPPWVPGPTVAGVTCARVLDDEEDFSDLAQAGAKTLTGKPSSVVSSCLKKRRNVNSLSCQNTVGYRQKVVSQPQA